MNRIQKAMLSLLVTIFHWEYGANAMYYATYSVWGTYSNCEAFCTGRYSSYNVHTMAYWGCYDCYTADYGKFDSCQCFTSAEATVIKNCASTNCLANYNEGTLRAAVYSTNTSTWCTFLASLSSAWDGMVANCKCAAGSYGSTIYDGGTSVVGGISCTYCPCGSYCTGGTRYSCGAGKYSSAGAKASGSCSTVSKGYWANSSCSPQKCPENPPATTSSSASSSVRNCYYPADSEIEDDTGTYLFTSNCFYSG